MNPERLNFSMPAFARRCWVSEAARARWEAPLQDLADRTRALEWRSVAAGLRAAALVDHAEGQASLCQKQGQHAAGQPLTDDDEAFGALGVPRAGLLRG